MSDPFDPYREWLSVQDPQRPPNHYVLLGLDLFEHDREKIWNTSMGLMAAVLEHDPGPHCEEARRLFDELERARDCLCNPLEKQAYDARLRERRCAAPTAGSGRRKSWGSLPAPARGSSVIQDESRSDSSYIIAETASGSSIGRRTAVKPEDATPAQSRAANRHWEIQHPRLASAALGLLLLAGLIGYAALREPPEYDPVPALVAQLRSSDPHQRIAAARALRKLGPRMSDELPQLVKLLAHEGDDDVRVAIAEAVREAGPGTVAYSRDFEIIKIRDTHPGVRQIMDELIAK